jgi:hypothetical protein
MRAQGATEYLVLLAVVLIVALVSVALLGFFPGMASDAQKTQSQTYWKSMSPISIIEMDAYNVTSGSSGSVAYLRLRNVGAYPIRLTKMIGQAGYASWIAVPAPKNISDYFYMAPGEEKYFGTSIMGGSTQFVYFYRSYGSNGSTVVSGLTSECTNSAPWGTLVMPGFGFEYIEYLDNGQQITKQEIGAKPLVITCSASSASW